MANDFTYLDSLIHSGKRQIVLTDDIILADGESGYVNIDEDNLVICGNNHIIDARYETGIFKISARNVTIRNLRFKHGRADDGGAIINEGDVDFVKCKFSFNEAESSGGAIFNKGRIRMSKCRLIVNESQNGGGAICNAGEAKLEGCLLTDNTSDAGGAILNDGRLEIEEGGFHRNLSRRCGGAIANRNEAIISKASFFGNVSKDIACAIYNLNEISVSDSKFKASRDYIVDGENAASRLEDNVFIE